MVSAIALGLVVVVVLYQSAAIWAFGRGARPRSADVILVMGPRLQGESLDELGRARARTAARLWHQGWAPEIVASGGIVAPGTIPEGEAIRRELIALGVDDGAVMVETTSRNTRESLEAAGEVMRVRGWSSAILVSNPFHLRRSVRLAEQLGLEVSADGEDPANFAVSQRAWWFLREVGACVYYGVW